MILHTTLCHRASLCSERTISRLQKVILLSSPLYSKIILTRIQTNVSVGQSVEILIQLPNSCVYIEHHTHEVRWYIVKEPGCSISERSNQPPGKSNSCHRMKSPFCHLQSTACLPTLRPYLRKLREEKWA